MSGISILQIVLFIAISIGIGLVVFALFKFSATKKENDSDDSASVNSKELENAIKDINKTKEEIDKTMEEFSELTGSVFREIDEKYHELLFLYTLMDDKKTEIDNFYKESKQSTPSTSMPVQRNLSPEHQISQKATQEKKIKERATISNPKLDQIIELEKLGLSLSEIAKKLDMGQGEVKLILELGRVR